MQLWKVVTALTLIAVCLGFTGCNECNQEEKNKEIVQLANDAMNNHEFEKLDQFFAKDFTRHCQATPEVQIKSLEEMTKFVKIWYTSFPDAKMETKLTAAENDLVAVWGTFTGTHEAPMGDIPATGKKMESETFAFFRIENGKIAELWVTWDNVAILKQLGLFPPPTPDQP